MLFVQFTAARADTGAALASPTVAVYETGTTALAAIYDASGDALLNPFTGGSGGLVGFAAPDGTYDIQLSSAGYTAPLIAGYQIVDALAVSTKVTAIDTLLPTPEQYGTVGAGSDQTAIAAAGAALPATGGKVTLGAKQYGVSAAATFSTPGVTIEGQGPEASRLNSIPGNHDFLVFGPAQTANPGANVRNLGFSSSVTQTAGRLANFMQRSFVRLRDLFATTHWNGFYYGGGNNITAENITTEGATSDRDEAHTEAVCSTSASSSWITVTGLAALVAAGGVAVGMYIFGVGGWSADLAAGVLPAWQGGNTSASPLGWVPNQPNTPYASAIQVLAISGDQTQVQLGLNGTAVNAQKTLASTDVQFAVGRSIYGYHHWINGNAKNNGAQANSSFSKLNAFGVQGASQMFAPGHGAYRYDGVGTHVATMIISTKNEVGVVIEENGPDAVGAPSHGSAFFDGYAVTSEHNLNAVVLTTFSRIFIQGQSDLQYGDAVIIGADANYNIPPANYGPGNSQAGDITLEYSANTAGGHGYYCFAGNITIIGRGASGNGNPPGQPYNNNTKDAIHLDANMALANGYSLKVVGATLGGAGLGLAPEEPTSGHCTAASASGSSTIYPPNKATGPNGLATLTLYVISGAGSTTYGLGTSGILISASSYTQLTTTCSTTLSAAAKPRTYTFTIPAGSGSSAASGINVGDLIFCSFVRNGATVTATQDNGDGTWTITSSLYMAGGGVAGSAVSFGAGNFQATTASPLTTALDTTSVIQFTPMTQRAALGLDGGPSVTFKVTMVGCDVGGNITGPIYAPGGAVIAAGAIHDNTGIDDVQVVASVTSGALGLAINPVQMINASATITSVVRDSNAAYLPIIQIPGTKVTLLPTSGAIISTTAGNNVANSYTGTAGRAVTMTLSASGKYWFS